MNTKNKSLWLAPEAAPKDGTMIIADIGLPWSVPCVWNDAGREWAIALLQACEIESGLDTYFEIEYEKSGNLKRWQPMPDIN